jgi:hypothetical protein
MDGARLSCFFSLSAKRDEETLSGDDQQGHFMSQAHFLLDKRLKGLHPF